MQVKPPEIEEGQTIDEILNSRLHQIRNRALRDAPVYLGHVSIAQNNLKQDLEAYCAEREQKTAQAYGGCTKCYGKGYGTGTAFLRGSADFEYKESLTKQDSIHLCECDRGKQLGKVLAERERLVRIDEMRHFFKDKIIRGGINRVDYMIVMHRLDELQQQSSSKGEND